MHPVLIFVIVVIVMVFLFLLFSSNPSTLANLANLKKITIIPASKLDNPASSRYYFEGWFFIDNNFPVDKENILFRRGNDLIIALKGSQLTLFANSSKNKTGGTDITPLFSTTAGSKTINDDNQLIPVGDDTTKGSFRLPITSAFPFQKWAYLVVHCDGNVVDIYLDGKMVASQQKHAIQFGKDEDVTIGNKHTDGRAALFNYVPDNITPQEVWSRYMYNSITGNANSTYKVSVDVLRNNSVKQTVNIV